MAHSPFATPEYRAAVRAARKDPTHAARHMDTLYQYLRAVASFRPALPGAGYPNLPAFILGEGRAYTPAPRPRGLRKMANRLCYRNALYTAWDHPEWQYVEGYAVSLQGIPCEHAWVVTPEGVVVDPTWHDPDLAAYYGVAIPTGIVGAHVSRNRVFGVLVNDWRNGCAILKSGRLALPEEEAS